MQITITILYQNCCWKCVKSNKKQMYITITHRSSLPLQVTNVRQAYLVLSTVLNRALRAYSWAIYKPQCPFILPRPLVSDKSCLIYRKMAQCWHPHLSAMSCPKSNYYFINTGLCVSFSPFPCLFTFHLLGVKFYKAFCERFYIGLMVLRRRMPQTLYLTILLLSEICNLY